MHRSGFGVLFVRSRNRVELATPDDRAKWSAADASMPQVSRDADQMKSCYSTKQTGLQIKQTGFLIKQTGASNRKYRPDAIMSLLPAGRAFALRATDGFGPARFLPRASNVIRTELVGVAGPVWGAVEATASRSRRIGTATKLMVDGVHEILANAPRIGLPHVCGWWNNQCQRLSVHLVVVISMPRSVHGKVVGPYLGHSVRIAGGRSGLRGCDGSGHQADGKDDSMDHGRLIHQGVLDRVSTVSGLNRCWYWKTSGGYAGSSNKRCSLSGEQAGNSRKLGSYSCHDRSHNSGGTGFDADTACGVGKKADRCRRCDPRWAEWAWVTNTSGRLLGWHRPGCRSCRTGQAGRSPAEFPEPCLRRSLRRPPQSVLSWQVRLPKR